MQLVGEDDVLVLPRTRLFRDDNHTVCVGGVVVETTVEVVPQKRGDQGGHDFYRCFLTFKRNSFTQLIDWLNVECFGSIVGVLKVLAAVVVAAENGRDILDRSNLPLLEAHDRVVGQLHVFITQEIEIDDTSILGRFRSLPEGHGDGRFRFDKDAAVMDFVDRALNGIRLGPPSHGSIGLVQPALMLDRIEFPFRFVQVIDNGRQGNHTSSSDVAKLTGHLFKRWEGLHGPFGGRRNGIGCHRDRLGEHDVLKVAVLVMNGFFNLVGKEVRLRLKGMGKKQ